jgi:hypothetical protein
MSILAHRISYLTHYKLTKNLWRFCNFKKKEVLNFNLVSETQPKNKHSNLFVRSLKFLRTHNSKKKRSSETRFETISYSHLASKFKFWRTPRSNFGPAETPTSAFFLDKTSQKRRFNNLTVFEASFRFRHVSTYRLKQTTKQKTPSTKKCLLLQYSNQLWAENTFFPPRLKIFCFQTKHSVRKTE